MGQRVRRHKKPPTTPHHRQPAKPNSPAHLRVVHLDPYSSAATCRFAGPLPQVGVIRQLIANTTAHDTYASVEYLHVIEYFSKKICAKRLTLKIDYASYE
jgi:hypothetical protein